MSDFPHYRNFDNISEAVLGFVHWAREEGMPISIQESKDALKAAAYGCLDTQSSFRYALKALFCTGPDDRALFDQLFEHFWGREKMRIKSRTTMKNASNIRKESPASLVWMGSGQEGEEREEEARKTSGANQQERLRKTDFGKLTQMESEELEEIATKLWQQMSLRLKRKMRSSPKGDKIDLRNTLRANISRGGEMIELRKRRKKPRKQKLLILLDVSGSMDTYSFYLLRFICALRTHFESIEAFIFSTKLIRITDYLNSSNLEATLWLLSRQADNWSSGTKIGACLLDFNERYAREIMHGPVSVIILSDGLETGDTNVLEAELKKIKLRTRQLIWLNPLKGMQGYQPIQKGMSAVLPDLDVFQSAHNLDSLLQLENLLLHV